MEVSDVPVPASKTAVLLAFFALQCLEFIENGVMDKPVNGKSLVNEKSRRIMARLVKANKVRGK